MIKLGMIGPEIGKVQTAVNKFFGSAVLVVDNHYGPKSVYYVKEFQKKMGLTPDGVVGPKTSAMLFGEIAPAPEVPAKPPVAQPSGDYPPFANVMKEKMPERGVYAKGSPLGVVVHFTAGHDGAAKTILGGIKNKYTFWCIERDGDLFCAHRYKYWGYHAGESGWRMLAKKLVGSVSDDLLGIEINAYGRVDAIKGKPGRYLTWFKKEIGDEEVRYTPGGANQCPGYYHVYTAAQIETLIKTILWLKAKNPDVFDFDYVLGHDEVSGPTSGITKSWRKNDPGAALPMTMPEFRALLKKRWANQEL